MTGFSRRRLAALALATTFGAGALGVMAPSTAWAQLGGGPVGTTGHAGRVPNAPEKPPEPAPDAIPGAKPRETAAPATRPAGDMQPTDALFDAINRGDIASARDALNRGADLNGVNILGMTPMELSVDLGRNDISFLLLSMRGEDSGRGSRALGRDTPALVPFGQTAQAGKPAAAGKAGSSKVASGKVASSKAGSSKAGSGKAGSGKVASGKAGQTVAHGVIPPKQVATPKLFANDGGTPLPSAGFLGFDSRSASN